jgi:hypothetical protein
MAQPSGLATDGMTLYVADSETSSLRRVDLGHNGHVGTIVGEGLFAFGDQDGIGAQVRLQHPLGLALYLDRLYVADTYNHKIKLAFPDRNTVQTYLGHGRPGHTDGQVPAFYEPGGISVAAGKLYIADTNNHAIRVADLHSGEVTTLKLTGLAMPTAMVGVEGMAWMEGETIILPSHSLKAGVEGQLVLHFELPAGYKLNPAAPVHYEVHVHGDGLQVPNSGRPQSAHIIELPLTIPFRTMAGVYQTTIDVEATFYWCRDDDTGLCLIQSSRWHVPVDISEAGGPPSITLSTTGQLQDVAGAPLSPSPPLQYKGNGLP